MRFKHLRSLVILATLALIGIVVVQVYWVNQAIELQKKQLILEEKSFNQQEKQFNDRVTIALTNVAEEILNIYNDPSELHNAVEQPQSNFFLVRMNDTLHPYLLESLLQKEFSRRNIKEDFEYAVYDCFSDSVVYGNFIPMDTIRGNDTRSQPDIKWEKDGHYFSVYFPNRESFKDLSSGTFVDAWFYTTVIILIVIVFFGYATFLLLKQKRLSDIKNDFINNMTHELKTPISTIGLSSEVLMKEDILTDPERIKRYASIIRTENKRLEAQVERVLQLATLDKEKVQLKYSSVELNELIKETLDSFRIPVESQGGELTFFSEEQNCLVKTDRFHLSNVLFNLLDNARKYSKDIPQIKVELKKENGFIWIWLHDKGIGIPKESQRHIFEKFYRVPTGNIHNVKGFGIGLHYVKTIVDQLGGKIVVQSEKGEGSSFGIALPKT